MLRCAFALFLILMSCAVVAEEDCARAQNLVALARQQCASSDKAGALESLEQPIAACRMYETYEEYAELASTSTARADHEKAAAAVRQADILAPSSDARAHTLYLYAQLVELEGEPQNAFELLSSARHLKSGDPEIEELTARVDREVGSLNKADLLRALMYPLASPLRISTNDAPTTFASASRASAQPGIAPTVVVQETRQNAGIPIHFDTGETDVDAADRANIETLADVLTSPDLKGWKITLIGHADRRGGDAVNGPLSVARAESIMREVIRLQPTLAGQIFAEGLALARTAGFKW
jgi:outer membrane protein OmpA-like peptidoglycan-associated protein